MNLMVSGVVVVYLGRKGGGNHFTLHIVRQLILDESITDLTVVILKHNFLLKQYLQLNGCQVIVLKSRMTAIPSLMREFKEAKSGEFSSRVGPNAIFTMPSPFDSFVARFFKKKNYKILRILHDARKHPGDLWPRNFQIERMVKSSDALIAPSNYVASEILRLYGREPIVYEHPIFDLDSYGTSKISLPTEFTLLYIGRIRKYKGINNLIAAFNLLPTRYDVKLLIAGEGTLNHNLPKKCLLVNRWLTEGEIDHLIDSAEVVIFPYMEASQSGLLPIVVNKGRKVVLTPLPGLIEQVKDYEAAYITEDFEPNSISLEIQRALQAPYYDFRKKNDNHNSFADIIRKIVSSQL
jgi:glycosyltransferase involved in cell wall biosynthesis